MKRMRIKSSKLAALLLLFTLPLASIPAFAANTQKPELVFVQGDNGDPTTATRASPSRRPSPRVM